MAHVDIRIELEGGEPEHGWLRYAPGGTVRGTLRITPNEPMECRHVWVRLEWMTEGRGTRDTGRAAELTAYQGRIPAEGIIQKFALTLPEQPHSYRGKLVSIVWGVVAEVDVSWMKKPRAIQSFVMAPGPHPAPNDQPEAASSAAEDEEVALPEPVAATTPRPPATTWEPAGWDLIIVSPGLQFRELGRALMDVMPDTDMAAVQRANSIEPLKLLRNVPEQQARQAAARLQGAGATTEVHPSGPE